MLSERPIGSHCLSTCESVSFTLKFKRLKLDAHIALLMSASYRLMLVCVWAMSDFQIGLLTSLLWPITDIRISWSRCASGLWVIFQLAHTPNFSGQSFIYVLCMLSERPGSHCLSTRESVSPSSSKDWNWAHLALLTSAPYQLMEMCVWAMSDFQIGLSTSLLWPITHICIS